MTACRFLHLDVFTGELFGGNQLAVFPRGSAVIPADRARDILNLQGVHMGRPSWIRMAIDAADGEISRVQVGGRSVFVAEGALTVDV